MGGDGGVIANDRRFIRGIQSDAALSDGKNVTRHQIMRSKICAQSCQVLSEPIVACELGNMYSKEALLESFLNKTLNPSNSHIRGLKDIKQLKLTRNPISSIDSDSAIYICPVTNMEFNGIHPFIYIWSTGWVLSEKAIKEIGINALQPEYGPFATDDIVRLLPLESDLDEQRNHMEMNRQRRDSNKSGRKSNKRDRENRETITTEADSLIGDVLKGDCLSKSNVTDDTNIGKESSIIKKSKNKKYSSTSGDNTHNQYVSSGKLQSTDSSSGPSNITAASAVAKKAAEAVENQELKSSIFKDLFHKNHEADKKDRDLFMSVSGLRYSIS